MNFYLKLANVSNTQVFSSRLSIVVRKPSNPRATVAESSHDAALNKWYVLLFSGLTAVYNIVISPLSSALALDVIGASNESRSYDA